jgi:hypothetical protein
LSSPLPARRKALEWGAAALVAAALYVTPSAAIGAILIGSVSSWILLAGGLAVLIAYASRTSSPLVVLGLLVVVAFVEYAAAFGTAMGQRCGTSTTAKGLEIAGTAALLLGLGAWGIRSRRPYALPVALVVAAAWVILIAHVVPGGSGECFN